MVKVPVGLFRLVPILRVEVADVLPGVTDAGVNEQVDDAGRPEQLKSTDDPYVPPRALTVKVEVVVWPREMLALTGESETA